MIKQCIFPIAGMGKRFLPISKVVPKELLPIVNRPMLHYSILEAILAGVTEFFFITRDNKSLIQQYILNFFKEYHFSNQIKFQFIEQKEPNGLGDAILCAENYVSDDNFGVILPDDIIFHHYPCLQELIDIYNCFDDKNLNILATEKLPGEFAHKYGIIDFYKVNADLEKNENVNLENMNSANVNFCNANSTNINFKNPNDDVNNQNMDLEKNEFYEKVLFAKNIIEKPQFYDQKFCYAIVGRYVLCGDIFSYLHKTQVGFNEELQLTDAIANMLKEKRNDKYQLICKVIDGKRFDCGNPDGLYDANNYLIKKKKNFQKCCSKCDSEV